MCSNISLQESQLVSHHAFSSIISSMSKSKSLKNSRLSFNCRPGSYEFVSTPINSVKMIYKAIKLEESHSFGDLFAILETSKIKKIEGS